jgi:hypothetical protein
MGFLTSLPDSTGGAVLKRDILGKGPASSLLVAPISAVDFLKLLTSETLSETPTAAQVRTRLEELSAQDIGAVAHYYASNKESLSKWVEDTCRAIIPLV